MGDDSVLAELLLQGAWRLAARLRRGAMTACPDASRRLPSSVLLRRDLNDIDGELSLIAALRRSARLRGGPLPANDRINLLLDERLLTAAIA
jgi:hypothetical protein